MSKKITIITATFNSSYSISSCLDSALKQDYPNIEILIIDGKSTDNTLDIIKEYELKNLNIKVYSEFDNGIYDALNKGINLASGDIIGFLHSDDFFASSNVLTNLVNKMKLDGLDGIYGDLQYVNKKNINKVHRNWISCDFDINLLKKGWMPAHPTFFLKKCVYKKHGFFDLNFSISADYDFMLRVLSDTSLKFGYLSQIITKMRIGGTSNRGIINLIKKSFEDFKAIKKNKAGNVYTLIRKNTTKLSQFLT